MHSLKGCGLDYFVLRSNPILTAITARMGGLASA